MAIMEVKTLQKLIMTFIFLFFDVERQLRKIIRTSLHKIAVLEQLS